MRNKQGARGVIHTKSGEYLKFPHCPNGWFRPYFIKKIEDPAAAAVAGILAIKESVISQENLRIAPRVISFLNEIKPYKEKLKIPPQFRLL
ncbi:hypothetical protein [Pedobacter cryoconitis]|uniref:Uncharacterized protein n=1 Tax=Pedobacter cryoconitis TaxID=188932 RepID=A0A327SDQ8_9SPHI|nr:hypothetical protein [Pedobacter cryoconitis]RAJ26064.1 hypothetical protein LY11_03997 [Pedobacter cryoconitis]